MANEQRKPLARTLPPFIDKRIRTWIAREGRAMPGHVVAVSGAIVTINFDVKNLTLPLVKMPLAGPEYTRQPIQIGDRGLAMPADTYTGGVSGLGLNVPADNIPQGNLSTLVWFPVGNANWTASPNPNALVMYGPEGVIVQDKAGSSPDFSITTNSSGITLTGGGYSISLSSSGITLTGGGHTVTLNATGLTIDTTVFGTHTHSLVVTGTDPSGPPVPGS